MKKAFIILAAALAAGCGRTGLEQGDWESGNYEALNAVIAGSGTLSGSYDPEAKPYAVFDFDNTTVTGDISLTLMAYQIENLRYCIDPEDIFSVLTDALPSIDTALVGFDGITARMLATDLQNDYAWLYENYIKSYVSGGKLQESEAGPSAAEEKLEDAEEKLAAIHESKEYLDFRAKLWGLSLGLDNTYGYGISCPWLLCLSEGMSEEQLQDLTREAALYDMKAAARRNETSTSPDKKNTYEEVWTSPDMGEAGVVSVTLERGFGIREELVNLYKTLADNGFDVYIISASPEPVVEAIACSSTVGLNLDPANVYGLRWHEGKSETIRQELMPLHGGNGPAIVGGDSNGDYNMLTDFADLQLGIIFDLPRSGAIQALKSDNSGKYIVQSW